MRTTQHVRKRADIRDMSFTRRASVAVTALVLTILVATSATAATDSDVALSDSDLSGWTDPGMLGPGPILVEEGEASEEMAPTSDDLFQATATAGPTDVVITGAGWSHGIGMSQYGSFAQALAYRTHSQILASYYPGASLSTNAASESYWVNLEQELVKVVLTAKQITTNPVPVTVTRGSESVTLANGQSVTIVYTGIVGTGDDAVRQCTFSSGGFASTVGPCELDVEWDGWAASPTMRVVIDKVWYHDSAAAGEECSHSVSPYTLECAYSRGTIHVRPDDNDELPPGDIGFHVVVEIDRDDYALGIGEVPYSWPTESLKTQAVASRSFASYVKDLRGPIEDRQWCWCNLYDQFPDQVYLGWGFGTSKWVGAVHATDGQLMTYGGDPVAAFFGSSNGGATENNEDIWNGAPIPYLRANTDVWSLHPVNSRRAWDSVISMATFASRLGFSSVDSVEIKTRYESGTPSDVVVTGIAGGSSTTKHFTGVEIQSEFRLISPHLNQIRGPFDPGEQVVDRRGGANRYETAVAVSWPNFASGSGPPVVVVRGDLFPDALSAAPLATSVSGPVLLTGSTLLPDVLAGELDRLDPSRIYIVGGSLAVSDSVAAELATYAPVTRVAGTNRFKTAVEVSKQVAPSGAATVFVASGTNYPDAVSGSAQAATRNAPLLLTGRDILPPETRSELDRLNPTEIVVVGGTAAVSDAVVTELRTYASTVTVLAGTDRFDTSAEISQWGYPNGAERAFLATASDFADALAGAAIAGAVNGPILLVSETTVSASVQTELQRLGVSRITLLGGPAAISYAVQDSVDDL